MTQRRLWTEDNMRWAMAPDDCDAGDKFEWAGNNYVVVAKADHTLRIKMIKQKGQVDANT